MVKCRILVGGTELPGPPAAQQPQGEAGEGVSVLLVLLFEDHQLNEAQGLSAAPSGRGGHREKALGRPPESGSASKHTQHRRQHPAAGGLPRPLGECQYSGAWGPGGRAFELDVHLLVACRGEAPGSSKLRLRLNCSMSLKRSPVHDGQAPHLPSKPAAHPPRTSQPLAAPSAVRGNLPDGHSSG